MEDINIDDQSEIKGWACHGKDLELVKFQYKPAPLLEEDVEVEISHCGICGSDIHTLDSGWGPCNYPVIVGHEIVGKVVKVGKSVKDLKVGDRVGIGAQAAACMQKDCFACSRNREVHCPKRSSTYNSKRYIDGSKTFGGYSDAIRVQSHFAFKIPESISSEHAAPLLCAGTTVYTPMLHHQFKKGDKVGVVGIGGLGHLAIQFAKALGCEVFALSHSEAKKDHSKQLGADHFINYSQIDISNQILNELKFLLVTTNAKDSQLSQFASWMDIDGKIILLAIPEEPLSIKPFTLISKNLSLTGSWIGSINEIPPMLEFAAKNNISPWIEKFPMDQVNQGIQHVRDGKVRYRVVLEN